MMSKRFDHIAGGVMNRAVLVALGTGAVISSAAALSIGTASAPAQPGVAKSQFEQARLAWNAREAQRAQIEARYLVARAQCDGLGGARRDRCVIAAHAAKGRMLLDTQAPYEMRSRS
jgi:hypothetical protein